MLNVCLCRCRAGKFQAILWLHSIRHRIKRTWRWTSANFTANGHPFSAWSAVCLSPLVIAGDYDASSSSLSLSSVYWKRAKSIRQRKRKLALNKLNAHAQHLPSVLNGSKRRASHSCWFSRTRPCLTIGKNVKTIGRMWNSFNCGRLQ